MSTGDHEPTTLDGGRYEVRRLIGRGGMGDVFLAWDTRLQRDVAVKQLRPEFVTDPDVLARFDREAHALARVSHPAVIHVYDRFTGPDGSRFIVLQYVPGESLDALIRRGGALPWARCVRVGAQVCGALEAAHRAGVIHRDVKPGNVLLDEAGDAHVADFGIARLGDAGVTRTNVIVGTAGYIAPEAASGAPVTPAVDEYGLAATLFEAYCGVPPYTSEGGPAGIALVRHVTAPVPDPADHRPDVPPAVRAFLMRGMAKAPGDRFGGAEAMRRALEETLTHPHATVPVPPPHPRADAQPTLVTGVPAPTAVAPAADAGTKRGWRPWMTVLCALAALGVGTASVYALLHDPGRDPAPGTTAAAASTPQAPQPTVDTFDTSPAPPPAPATTAATAPATVPTTPAEPTVETTPATPGTTPTVPPPGPGDGTPTVDEARALTDEAAGDIDSGDYDAAIDKSERALTALEGTGDPYEANALYNLGYAIYLRGDCSGSVEYLQRAADHATGTKDQRKERRATLKRARDCAA